MSKRSIRRHHYNRLKRKRRDYYGGFYRDRPESIAAMVNTPTTCSRLWSCGCGNWRRLGLLPTQERRHLAGCSVDEDLIYHRVA